MSISAKLFGGAGRPLILAHRGSPKSANFPENTIPAFREAVELGADGFELDIHLTKDKELVVFHDYRLKRLMGVPGGVSSLDSREISQLSFAGPK